MRAAALVAIDCSRISCRRLRYRAKNPYPQPFPRRRQGKGVTLPPPLTRGRVGVGVSPTRPSLCQRGHGWEWNSTFNTYRTQRPVYPAVALPIRRRHRRRLQQRRSRQSISAAVPAERRSRCVDRARTRHEHADGHRRRQQRRLLHARRLGEQQRRLQWNVSIGDHRECHGDCDSHVDVHAAGHGNLRRLCAFPQRRDHTHRRCAFLRRSRRRDHAHHHHAGARWQQLALHRQLSLLWRTGRRASPSTINQPRRASPCWPMPCALAAALADTSAPDTSVISDKPRWEEQSWTVRQVGGPARCR